jgi:hypothetical protein
MMGLEVKVMAVRHEINLEIDQEKIKIDDVINNII